MHSFPQCFNMKVTTTDEANDVTAMKLDELFGSLRTFELNLGEGNSKKKYGVAFSSVSEDVSQSLKEHISKENLAKQIVFLTKQLSKLWS